VGNLKDFYATTAQACFTVLSVWWVILSLNFKEWVRDPHRRLMVYDVSLYFLLPGLMSLVSLLAIGVPEIWRVAFALAGIVGAIESVVLPIRRVPHGRAGAPVRAADWVSFVLFGLIALVAVAPSLVETAGIGLRPLELEGALITGILVVGFSLAWLMFVTSATGEEETADETPAAAGAERSPGDAPAPRPRPALDA
jgi:hypothetical protein